MKFRFFVLAIALFSPHIMGGTVDVEYKSFYSHVRKLENEDTQDLQFSFGFMHIDTQALCQILEAKIVTQKQTIPIAVTNEYRFTMPSEKALKLADALVNIRFTEPSNKCDMSVQLETKPALLKQQYASEELDHIYGQYTAFFNEMGSFLSFLMPSVKGLMVYFKDTSLTQMVNDTLKIQNGVLIINEEDLEGLTQLDLPATPLRITALAKR